MSAKRYHERSAANIQAALGNGEAVGRFAMKYGNPGSKLNYLSILKHYFAWLKSRGMTLSPDELVTDNLVCVFKSDPTDVRTKRRHRDLMNEYLNVHLKEAGLSLSYRRSAVSVISGFYRANDSELFGDFQLATQEVTPPSKALKADDIRKVLKALPVNLRTPLLVEWQSGIEINRVLSLTWKEIPGLEKGDCPVRIDLFGRKRHRKSYATFIGRDSIDHIKTLGRTAEHVFVAKGGGYMNDTWLNRQLQVTASKLSRERIIDEYPLGSWHTHALRHSFETEASHAKVPAEIRDFFLGHVQGIQFLYNHRDELHPEDLIAEYRKIEPLVSLDFNEAAAKEEMKNREKALQAKYEEVLKTVEALKGALEAAGVLPQASQTTP